MVRTRQGRAGQAGAWSEQGMVRQGTAVLTFVLPLVQIAHDQHVFGLALRLGPALAPVAPVLPVRPAATMLTA